MADEDKGASKYAYLLQPIKDLERNFAINIVELLEEYTKTLDAVAAAENFQIDNAHRFVVLYKHFCLLDLILLKQPCLFMVVQMFLEKKST